MKATATLFLSAVTDEFAAYRKSLRKAMDLPGLRVEIQESFVEQGVPKLVEISNVIGECDAVAHLLGVRSGFVASPGNRDELLKHLPDLPEKLGLDARFIERLTYTQWEAWLAIYHNRRLYIARHTDANETRLDENGRHLEELRKRGFYPSPSLQFGNEHDLVIAFLKAWREFRPAANIVKSPELPPSLGELFKEIGRAHV